MWEASTFLRAFGHIAIAWIWLDLAIAAQRSNDPAFAPPSPAGAASSSKRNYRRLERGSRLPVSTAMLQQKRRYPPSIEDFIMTINLEGRVAIVTGAGRGLDGRTLLRLLREERRSFSTISIRW